MRSEAKPHWGQAFPRVDGRFCVWRPQAASTTVSRRSSAASCTTPAHCRQITSRESRPTTATSIWPHCPTACGPNVSRASPSTSPTGSSRVPHVATCSPIPRGMSATPATRSPEHRTLMSRYCSSTHEKACYAKPVGMRVSPRWSVSRTSSPRSTRSISSTSPPSDSQSWSQTSTNWPRMSVQRRSPRSRSRRSSATTS